jgi:hypothetical protein
MIARTLGMPHLTDTSHQLRECSQVSVVENPFLCAHTETNLGCADERPWFVSQPCPCKLQTVTTKSDLRR